MLLERKLGELEAVLFASGDPIGVPQLAEVLGLEKPQVWELLTRLKEACNQESRGIVLREVADGFQLATKPCHHETVMQLAETQELRLTTAAMETVAIVAFHQPVTKAEIEAIRGVKIDSVLATLVEWDLVVEVGRKETVGRPILYGTTARFLETFGIRSLEELPPMPEILVEDLQNRPEQLSLLEAEDGAEAPEPGTEEPDMEADPFSEGDAGADPTGDLSEEEEAAEDSEAVIMEETDTATVSMEETDAAAAVSDGENKENEE